MFDPSTFMLLSSRFWKKPKDSHHKHHSIEAFKDNMHGKFLQIYALQLQLVVETMIDAIKNSKEMVKMKH